MFHLSTYIQNGEFNDGNNIGHLKHEFQSKYSTGVRDPLGARGFCWVNIVENVLIKTLNHPHLRVSRKLVKVIGFFCTNKRTQLLKGLYQFAQPSVLCGT